MFVQNWCAPKSGGFPTNSGHYWMISTTTYGQTHNMLLMQG